MKIRGQIVDVFSRTIYPGEVIVENRKIKEIKRVPDAPPYFIMPGFVDAHIHIESSMLVPSEFARMAVIHGTVATVSDPHEIANVLGVDGVHFMIDNGKSIPFKFHFGAPSCVPATAFETAGDCIDARQIKELLKNDDIYYLAEMMNYPGVIHEDPEVLQKLRSADEAGKPIDGHAPGVRGKDLEKYCSFKISTDHECVTADEAEEKLRLGMKILIREGSAAKNFDALAPLIPTHFPEMMFCSDDKHPDDLLLGHINQLCARAVAAGCHVFDVLQMACINPVLHYNLRSGLLRVDDPADFIVVEDLTNFNPIQTYIDGQLVAENGRSYIASVPFETPNKFACRPKIASDFELPAMEKIRVIEALDGQLITKELVFDATTDGNFTVADPARDLLKICVVNRYSDAPPAVAFVKNFGLHRGAIAGSVAHDCHNIVVVGTSDTAITKAVNLIIRHKGGICAVDDDSEKILPLPVAGIMSDQDGIQTGRLYQELDEMAKALGSTLRAPFMTLSFMALLVIPDLKISDLGLFSGSTFSFTPVEAN